MLTHKATIGHNTADPSSVLSSSSPTLAIVLVRSEKPITILTNFSQFFSSNPRSRFPLQISRNPKKGTQIRRFRNPRVVSELHQMHLQAQTLTNQFVPSVSPLKPTSKSRFAQPNGCGFRRISHRALKCSVSAISELAPAELRNVKTFPAEVSRTIMELSSVGTLSSLSQEGWPLGIGVRFAVDQDGTPLLSLDESVREFSTDRMSSLHVQLEQCGLRTPQCTIQGSLGKPDNKMILKRLHTTWKKRFGEEINEDLLYVVSVERVLQIDDFGEVGVWVNSSDYRTASPDPLRNCAERLVHEINTNNAEDVNRFCNIYADLNFQFTEAKLIWIDRLGFDMHVFSPQRGTFELRIPFPREVTDEKGAKSTFNGMSQQAWEVERNFQTLNFERVKQFKMIKPLLSVE